MSHLRERAGGDGDDGTLKVICYDSAGWVRENFQAKVDKHNEVGVLSRTNQLGIRPLGGAVFVPVE